MKFYRITLDVPGDKPRFRRGRELAHAAARAAVTPSTYRNVRVEQIEINPQVSDIADMLEGNYDFAAKVSAQRTWGLSPRGALVELKAVE